MPKVRTKVDHCSHQSQPQTSFPKSSSHVRPVQSPSMQKLLHLVRWHQLGLFFHFQKTFRFASACSTPARFQASTPPYQVVCGAHQTNFARFEHFLEGERKTTLSIDPSPGAAAALGHGTTESSASHHLRHTAAG